MIALNINYILRGKSEHRRTWCPVTQGIREDMESAAEKKPPNKFR